MAAHPSPKKRILRQFLTLRKPLNFLANTVMAIAIDHNWFFLWEYTFSKWGNSSVLATATERAITAETLVISGLRPEHTLGEGRSFCSPDAWYDTNVVPDTPQQT